MHFFFLHDHRVPLRVVEPSCSTATDCGERRSWGAGAGERGVRHSGADLWEFLCKRERRRALNLGEHCAFGFFFSFPLSFSQAAIGRVVQIPEVFHFSFLDGWRGRKGA